MNYGTRSKLRSATLLTVAIATTASAGTIYRQDFGNASSIDTELSTAGWKGHFGASAASATLGSTGYQLGISSSDYAFGTNNTSGSAVILWSDSITFDAVAQPLESVSWQTRHATATATSRLVLRIDNTWYAHTTPFTSSQSATFETKTVTEFSSATGWRSFSFAPGSSLDQNLSDNPAGALPSGSVTGFGVYLQTPGVGNTDGRTRVGNFVIQAADLPPDPNRFQKTVQRFADAMLAAGRDTYGTGAMPNGADKRSGLFVSAMDRTAVGGPKLLTGRPTLPFGVRQGDRVGQGTNGKLIGANVMHDQGLLLTLNELSRQTGQSNYAQASDASIKWLFDNARSGANTGYTPGTNLLPWGEHLSWDIERDIPVSAHALEPEPNFEHEFYESWRSWSRTHALSPTGAKAFALGLWDHQIRVKTDNQPGDVGNIGDYDRHGEYDNHAPQDEFDFPRHGGYFIGTWGEALKHTAPGETMVDERGVTRDLQSEYRAAIDAVLTRFERKRANPLDRGLIEMSDNPRDTNTHSTSSSLQLAIESQHAAGIMAPSDSLRGRLTKFAREEDVSFLQWDHQPATAGFVTSVTIDTKTVSGRSNFWGAAYGNTTTSGLAVILLDRYDQLVASSEPVDATQAGKYRLLLIGAADGYLTANPDTDRDGSLDDEKIWAGEFGDVILTQLAAWKLTQDARYLERAVVLGDIAINTFWSGYALPRASTDVQHYESITGSGTLAMALLELHAATVPEPVAASGLGVLGCLLLRRPHGRA